MARKLLVRFRTLLVAGYNTSTTQEIIFRTIAWSRNTRFSLFCLSLLGLYIKNVSKNVVSRRKKPQRRTSLRNDQVIEKFWTIIVTILAVHVSRHSNRSDIFVTRQELLKQIIFDLQGGPKKRGHRRMTIILSILNRFKNFFSLKDSLVNLQLRGYQKSHRTLHMLLHYFVKH